MTVPAPLKPLAQSGRLFLDRLRGRDLGFHREVRPRTEFHGNAYGGWAIIEDSLAAEATVISAGVGEDVSFDLSLIARYGCTVHALDPTPKAVRWVQQHVNDPCFVMHEVALSDQDGTLRLFLPENDAFVSACCREGEHTSANPISVPSVTLDTLFDRLDMDFVDVLKMDIEGSEYGVLMDGLATGVLQRVRQLLVEFHHHLPAFDVAATRGVVAALHEAGWRIGWVSPSHHELLFLPGDDV